MWTTAIRSRSSFPFAAEGGAAVWAQATVTVRPIAHTTPMSTLLLKYLFKCEAFPVVWYFTYYRDFSHSRTASEDENWVIIAVRFDTQLELLDQ